MRKLIVTFVAAAAVIACGGKNEAKMQPASTAAKPTVASAAAPTSAGQLTGTVLETFNAAGYSYLKLKTANGEEWAAVRETDLKQGATVTVLADMTAENFESKTLKRTFDKIVFGTVASNQAGVATPAAGANAMGTPADHMKPKVEVGDVNVPKADGPDAKRVADVWAAKSSIDGKPVVVRGKVVKYLGGIMGKNWVHLRDGSGTEDKGDNDLTVTTDDVVAVGDVVIVSGKVSVDKDFGAGYQYPVIVENAAVKK